MRCRCRCAALVEPRVKCGLHQHPVVSVCIRIRLFQAARDRRDLLPRLLERYAGLDPSPNLEIAEVALFVSVAGRAPASLDDIAMGMMNAGGRTRCMPVNLCGATPTTVKSRPPRRTCRPMTPGSDPNCSAHVSYASTTTASLPGTRSSSGRMARPSAGCSSSTSKKLPLTASPELALRGLVAPGREAREGDGVRQPGRRSFARGLADRRSRDTRAGCW